jgi:hypothetical protein
MILDIFLGDLMILNKKFQEENGSITGAKDLCIEIFLKFSNMLLSTSKRNISLNSRLAMLIIEQPSKKDDKKSFLFDILGTSTKNFSEITKYFIDRFGDSIPLKTLNKRN